MSASDTRNYGSNPEEKLTVTLVHALVLTAGGTLVVATVASAVQTIVLPRSAKVWLTRWVFRAGHALFRVRANGARSFEARDRIMVLFAPFTLIALPVVWLGLVLLGYLGMYWATGVDARQEAFRLSGPSLLTLGFSPPQGQLHTVLSFSEATIGLGLVALLIALAALAMAPHAPWISDRSLMQRPLRPSLWQR